LSQQKTICKSISGAHEKVLSKDKHVGYAMHERTPSVELGAGSKGWSDFSGGCPEHPFACSLVRTEQSNCSLSTGEGNFCIKSVLITGKFSLSYWFLPS